MSRYHNDDTYATNPGGLLLSEAKLRALEPELFERRTFLCGPTCAVQHPAEQMRERIAEHLQLGDSQPAVVISLDPLVVSVESVDLDAAALLRFPAAFVERYGLTVGRRLLSVNTYADLKRRDTGEPFYAVDLVPGPERSGWSNFAPFIAEFLSDEDALIERKRATIPEAQWARLEANTAVRVARFGLGAARDGRPTHAATPARVKGDVQFETLSGAHLQTGTPSGFDRRSIGLAVIALLLALSWYLSRLTG